MWSVFGWNDSLSWRFRCFVYFTLIQSWFRVSFRWYLFTALLFLIFFWCLIFLIIVVYFIKSRRQSQRKPIEEKLWKRANEFWLENKSVLWDLIWFLWKWINWWWLRSRRRWCWCLDVCYLLIWLNWWGIFLH